jgi:hypothetical protein
MSTLNIGDLGSKTRSHSPNMEKPEHLSGHNFALMVIKLSQNACISYFSDELDHGSSQMKN